MNGFPPFFSAIHQPTSSMNLLVVAVYTFPVFSPSSTFISQGATDGAAGAWRDRVTALEEQHRCVRAPARRRGGQLPERVRGEVMVGVGGIGWCHLSKRETRSQCGGTKRWRRWLVGEVASDGVPNPNPQPPTLPIAHAL